MHLHGRNLKKTNHNNTYPSATLYFLTLRMLTAKEHLRLMGFEDKDYQLMKNSGLTDQQISYLAGNSICIPVLEQIYLELKKLGIKGF